MGVTTYTQEFTTSVAPNKMFKALILDSHNLIPKLLPQSIKSIEYVQGNGGPGSIKQTNFHEESLSYEVKFEATADGGSKVTSTTYYHAKGDIELKVEELTAGKDKAMAMGMFKVIEEYLLANPNVYA
ncbi:hypothetical protein TEA_015638 [Camellia sinensis var. sinensis]|uniref:Bet v I/Major latex protein domain-containing protein n=1 Tax=Camellia sinensis var. sinensis TaxID=542762 RepID=A0A4V3WP26_CAMSN|nr:hypothetical protein TEA_015638 [Camellia sinensis var. sinensis]